MQISDLPQILARHNVPRSHYSLTTEDEPMTESYLCIRMNPVICIYIVERNRITLHRTFDTEDAACRAFLHELRITP